MNLLPSGPRCIGCNAPATIVDDPFLLCDACEAALTQSMNSVGSAFPKADLVTAGDAQPPASPALAVTPNSESPVGDRQAVVASELLDRPDVTAADGIPPFLRRSHPDCVVRNETTFAVTQASLIQAKSSSSEARDPSSSA